MSRHAAPNPSLAHTVPPSVTAPGLRRAFTLIELLVVVSIVAILIGLIIPGLQFARRTARDTACQANQHALAQAWHTYKLDKNHFPRSRENPARQHDPPRAGSWGGASPLVNTASGAHAAPSAKPLNEYVGLEARNRRRIEAFHCPRDDGAIYPREGVGLRQYGNAVYDGDTGNDESMYFLHGNSYYANDWVWADVGAIDGRGPASDKRWNHYLRPDVVLVSPATTLMLADGGAFHSISMTDEQVAYWNIPNRWWHGEGRMVAAMWDGSVRFVSRHIGGAGPEFNRWLVPEMHAPEGTPVAFFNAIRNPDLAHSDQTN